MNDILFAPQVRPVQPAVALLADNSYLINFYFSLSIHNNINEIQGWELKIIDPTLPAESEANLIWEDGDNSIEYYAETGEYFFGTTLFNEEKPIEVSVHKFYQAQIRLIGKNGNYSEWSQVTLVRFIPNISQENSTIYDIARDRIVSGAIQYIDQSTLETIDSYIVEIFENEALVYTTPEPIDNTGAGLSFSTKIDYYFKENESYTIKIHLTTINGYKYTLERTQVYEPYQNLGHWNNFSFTEITNEPNGGGVSLSFSCNANQNLKLLIQRSSLKANFYDWTDIITIPLNAQAETYNLKYKDYTVQSGEIYHYRFFVSTEPIENNRFYSAGATHYEYSPIFNEIYLNDSQKQLVLRYNPKISSIKLVTQENITNTLGGKFPLIRRNGNTYYKQLTISGTLYCDIEDIFINWNIQKDSQFKQMKKWLQVDNASLFINAKEIKQFQQDFQTFRNLNQFASDSQGAYNIYKTICNKKIRDAAISFLTDGKPKLFRSAQEGNIIVYLSNVSFAPNGQLDRNVYDFSATATEFCEVTENNLMKYELVHNNILLNKYVLKILGHNNEEFLDFTPYVSLDDVSSSMVLTQTEVEFNE